MEKSLSTFPKNNVISPKNWQLKSIFLYNYSSIAQKSDLLLQDSSCFKNLITNHLSHHPTELQQWIDEDYPHNEKYPEHLIHSTFAGHKVRSKSEAIIANALFMKKIPYRYEWEFVLDGISIFPDFTICNPRTMQITRWEHFGLMDDGDYQHKAYSKLKLYGQNGYVPSINMIATFETKNHPLDSMEIMEIIEKNLG